MKMGIWEEMGFHYFFGCSWASSYTLHCTRAFNKVVDHSDYRIKVFSWAFQPGLKKTYKTKDVWNEITSHRPDRFPKHKQAAYNKPLHSPYFPLDYPVLSKSNCIQSTFIFDYAAASDVPWPLDTFHATNSSPFQGAYPGRWQPSYNNAWATTSPRKSDD